MAGTSPSARRPDDSAVAPGWARRSETLFRYGGFVVGAIALIAGFLTGGFFLVLSIGVAVIVVVAGALMSTIVGHASWYSRPHALPLTAAILVGIPVAVLVFAQVGGPLLTPPATLAQDFSGDLSAGQERVHDVPVDRRLTDMQLSIEIESPDASTVRWTVTDPSGQTAWNGSTDQFGNSAARRLTPVPGQWTIHVVDDTGNASYAIAWRGWTADGPSPPPLP